MNRNRRLAELAGLIPYKTHGGYERCDCPDFISHPTLVLRELDSLGKLQEFLSWLYAPSYHKYGMVVEVKFIKEIVDYILDTTGKLRDAAIRFLEGRRND